MQYVPLSREPWVLVAALAGGIVIGFAPLQQIAAQLSLRAGLGNFVAVNVLLPATTLGLAVFFPRIRTAMTAGLLVVLGFVLARLLFSDVRIWTWQPQFVIAHTSPILLGAAVGCTVVGAFGAIIAGAFRCVGEKPHAPSCPVCGHALAASPDVSAPTRCPECGAAVVSGGARLR